MSQEDDTDVALAISVKVARASWIVVPIRSSENAKTREVNKETLCHVVLEMNKTDQS